ncbi:MAG: hypothetical protein MRZ79_27175 [Bacteroidia bacterium]|nr:hypothetical protein [Bacteroidia bacterium]
MNKLRYKLGKDWLFYLMVLGYAYLIINMTVKLWFGGGINIFATYSDAADPAAMLIDANKVYWSKTCFLFLTLLLYGLNFDYRFASGLAASFWSGSLMLMFAPSPVLIFVALIGNALVGQQIWRKQVFSNRNLNERQDDKTAKIPESKEPFAS